MTDPATQLDADASAINWIVGFYATWAALACGWALTSTLTSAFTRWIQAAIPGIP